VRLDDRNAPAVRAAPSVSADVVSVGRIVGAGAGAGAGA
jgi:hypothetical protein